VTTAAGPIADRRMLWRPEGPLSTWRTEIGVGSGLVLLVLLWAAIAPRFLTTTNITLLFQQTSVLMILAIGQTFVILTGEIDLSVGSMLGLSTVVLAALTVQAGVPVVLAIAAVVAMGAVAGLFTGTLRVVWEIPSFIVTLGLLTALSGVAFTLSGGVTISPTPDSLVPLWDGSLLAIPTPVWLMAIIVAVAAWVLRKTRYGRHIYAVGGNPEASRRYGVRVRALRISVFMTSGALAAFGGVLYTAQLHAGNATVGKGFELNVIAGVVVGGVSLFGGVGRLAGTVLGILFIAVLSNGLMLLGVSSYVFLIAQGFVVIGAVWWAALQKRRVRHAG
jgi:ribose/xylose/arabinose/galactoside ABC-type transport system permease subunit